MKPTGYEHSTNMELLLAIQVLEDRKSRIDKQIMLMKREIKRRKNENQNKQTRHTSTSLC
jgi:hypothetical protein